AGRLSPFLLPPFCVHSLAPPPALHSFPTRRSSDLRAFLALQNPEEQIRLLEKVLEKGYTVQQTEERVRRLLEDKPAQPRKRRKRSEEHTSELQSRENLVCRLLLEKKTGCLCTPTSF